ncbi:MAG: DUF6701 domain-containing protein [Pontibacterium sp.]
MNKFMNVVGFVLLLLFSINSYADTASVPECNAVFPDGVQSNSNGGSITFEWSARVTGSPDGILATKKLTDNSGGTSCDTRACGKSGSSADSMQYNTFPNNNNDLRLNYRDTGTTYPGDFDDIYLHTESTLTVTAGDYRIRGDLYLNTRAKIIIKGGGVVRLLVKGKLELETGAEINKGGSASRLIIYTRDDLKMKSGSSITGFVYSEKDVTLYHTSVINGALSGKKVKLNSSSSTVNFLAGEQASADFGSLCGGGDIAPPPPPDEVDAGSCEAIFPDGAQSHSAKGEVKFEWGAQVVNSPDNILASVKIEDNSGGVSCVSTTCTPSYTSSQSIDFDDFSSGGSDIKPGYQESLSLSPGSYKNIELDSRAVLTLQSGDYYLSESLKMKWASSIILPASGTTRLFIKKKFESDGSAFINAGGNADQLLVIAGEDIKLKSQDKAVGFFYARDEVELGHKTSVTGALSGEEVKLKSAQVKVYYDAEAQERADFGDICGGPAPPESLSPQLEYRFDELSWNGSSDEVEDSSNSGIDGTAINGADTESTGKVCRAGRFDGTNQYINVPDLSDHLNGTASLSFWIKTTQKGDNTAWRAPGVSGVEQSGGTDDIFWGWLDKTGHIGIAVGNANETKSKTAINNGSWHHVVLTRDTQAGEYKIYIDGEPDASGSIASGTIGPEYSGLGRVRNTSSRTAPKYFNGALDELLVFDDVLGDEQVNQIYQYQSDNKRWDGSVALCELESIVDHYAITTVSPALTCEASPVTVTAYDASGNPVAPEAGTTLTLSASQAIDGWSLNTGGGSFSAPDQYTFDGTETSVVFNLTRTTATTSPIDLDVTDGTVTEPDTGGDQDQPVVFADASFRFYADGTQNAIGPQISGKSNTLAPGAQSISLQAIHTDPTTGRCAALTTVGPVNLGFAYGCTNPSSCAISNNGLQLNSTPIDEGALSNSAAFETVQLTFDSSGSAPLTLNYQDAGQIELYVSADLAVPGASGLARVQGNSNSFVVKPAGLCVQASATGVDASCVAEDASCSVFVAAGTAFDLSLSGRQWGGSGDTDYCDNGLTPNFTLSNIALSHTLIAPAAGDAGNLGVSGASITTGGQVQINNQSVDEVGVFSITATPPAYLGESLAAVDSQAIGRFYPDHFELDSTESRVDAACSSADAFSYMGEVFALHFMAQAKNSANNTTVNYRDDFVKLDASSGSLSAGAVQAGTNLSARLVGTSGNLLTDSSFTWVAGEGEVLTPLRFQRQSSVDGPYDALALGVKFNDADGVALAASVLDLDVAGSGNEYAKLDDTRIRFGRLWLSNSYGPETAVLKQTLTAQYFDGSTFVQNSLDGCSPLVAGALSLQVVDDDTSPDDSLSLAAGLLTDIVIDDGKTDATIINTTLVAGASEIRFGEGTNGVPGAGNTASILTTVTAPTWLQFDWDANGSHDNNPGGSATFGRYRGHDRIIYWLEQ